MTDFDSFFNDDPWRDIDTPIYPKGRLLLLGDDRFFVSMDEQNRINFFVRERVSIDIKPLSGLSGIEIDIIDLKDGVNTLLCTLLDSSLKEKFTVVTKSVAFHCARYHGSQLLINAQNQIQSWANFLKPQRVGLSHSELIGFWGELYVLNDFFLKVHSPYDSIKFWIGPDNKKQDFTLNNSAFEVKTSVSGDAQAIQISSLEQLERITPKLYLLRLIVNYSSGNFGSTLQEMYNSCIDKLKGDNSAETLFLQKVSPLYGKASDEQLVERLAIVSVTLYEIRDDFPCLVRENISPYICDSSYSILLNGVKDFEIEQDIVEVIRAG